MDNLDAKLNAIVGAALRALMETGADDSQVGAFAAEHRVKVAAILGADSVPAGPPDLASLVREAMKGVLTEAGLTLAKAKSTTKRIFVVVGGKRTSITVDPGLFEKLSASSGGSTKARAVIRDLASKAPSTVSNRSGWIEERLIAITQLPAHSAPSRAH